MPHPRSTDLPSWTATIVLATLMLSASVAAAADAADTPEPWKLSTAVGPAFALGKAGDRWSKLIGERSGGKIAVSFHPGAALAHNDPAREFLALRDGAADLAVGSTLFWSSQVVDLNVFALPWLAPEDRELAMLAEGAVAERLFAAVERAGAVPLALAVLGHRALAMSGAVPRVAVGFFRDEGARVLVVARHRTLRRAGRAAANDGGPPMRMPPFVRGPSKRRRGRSRRSPPEGSTHSA